MWPVLSQFQLAVRKVSVSHEERQWMAERHAEVASHWTAHGGPPVEYLRAEKQKKC